MSAENQHRLILASRSPRRRTFLEQAGVLFEVVPPEVDEDLSGYADAATAVRAIAETKAEAVAGRFQSHFVLAADTIVVLGQLGSSSEEILGKPEDDQQAAEMLHKIQGRDHHVMTAFALRSDANNVSVSDVVTTRVTMTAMREEDVDAYVATGEPRDKAGAYGIQGAGGLFVQAVDGSYTNVVGLPMVEVLALLKQHSLWNSELLNHG